MPRMNGVELVRALRERPGTRTVPVIMITSRSSEKHRRLALDAGVDVRIGYIETHGRAGTEALVEGLPLVPRRRLFYKGKELEEMVG